MLGIALLIYGGWHRWPIWLLPLLALSGALFDTVMRPETLRQLHGAYMFGAYVAVHSVVVLLEYAVAYGVGRYVRRIFGRDEPRT